MSETLKNGSDQEGDIKTARKAELTAAREDYWNKRGFAENMQQEYRRQGEEVRALAKAESVFNESGQLIDRVGIARFGSAIEAVHRDGERFGEQTSEEDWYGKESHLMVSAGDFGMEKIRALSSVNAVMRELLGKPPEYNFVEAVENTYIIGRSEEAEKISPEDKETFRLFSAAVELKGSNGSSDPWEELDEIASRKTRTERDDLVDDGWGDDAWTRLYAREALLEEKDGSLHTREAVGRLELLANPAVEELMQKATPEQQPGETKEAYNERCRESVAEALRGELASRREKASDLYYSVAAAEKEAEFAKDHADRQAYYDTPELAEAMDLAGEIADLAEEIEAARIAMRSAKNYRKHRKKREKEIVALEKRREGLTRNLNLASRAEQTKTPPK